MSITVERTYDMSRALGTKRFEVEGAATAADIVRLTRARLGERAAEFARLTRVMFVKASAGGQAARYSPSRARIAVR